MLGFVLGVFICYVALLSVGTFWEKALHPELTTIEAMRKFKLSLVNILGEYFYKRHVFYPSLKESIFNIVQKYSEPNFSITCIADLHNNTPVISISFVLNQNYSDDELLRLCRLLQLKFDEYLKNNKLQWRNFIEYHCINETIQFYLYYEEAFFDRKPFMKRYESAIKEKVQDNYGILHDEELDKELHNVE